MAGRVMRSGRAAAALHRQRAACSKRLDRLSRRWMARGGMTCITDSMWAPQVRTQTILTHNSHCHRLVWKQCSVPCVGRTCGVRRLQAPRTCQGASSTSYFWCVFLLAGLNQEWNLPVSGRRSEEGGHRLRGSMAIGARSLLLAGCLFARVDTTAVAAAEGGA